MFTTKTILAIAALATASFAAPSVVIDDKGLKGGASPSLSSEDSRILTLFRTQDTAASAAKTLSLTATRRSRVRLQLSFYLSRLAY